MSGSEQKIAGFCGFKISLSIRKLRLERKLRLDLKLKKLSVCQDRPLKKKIRFHWNT